MQSIKPLQIADHGQVKRITFPPGWEEGSSDAGAQIGSRSFRQVNPDRREDVSVCFFYRGLPVDAEAGKNFHAILGKPPHVLERKEMESIDRVLQIKTPLNKFFDIIACHTIELNGKRVLVVEGRYPESGDHILEMYIDADGTGRVIQEIYYQAPKQDYGRYLRAVQSTFETIAWK